MIKWNNLLPKSWQAKRINFYAPYIGAGIKLRSVDSMHRRFVVEMPLNKWNKNIKGVHFGGSLYSMCDPFYMWILMENLGSDYIIWDKAATIEFLKPGTGTVRAVFEIDEVRIAQIREEIELKTKNDYIFETYIYNSENIKIAKVSKTVYVRKK